MSWVACGRFDAYWETPINSWDVLAGRLIVEEAGGWVSEFLSGKGFLEGNPILAAAPGIGAELRRLLEPRTKRPDYGRSSTKGRRQAAAIAEPSGKAVPLYSLWLLPDPDRKDQLLRTIEELAALVETPTFLPHVTIQGGILPPLDALRKEVLPQLDEGPPFSLEIQSVETSSAYFRSLYLRLGISPSFGRLQELTAAKLGTRAGLPPFPHLSLSYGKGPEPEGKRVLTNRLGAEYAGRLYVIYRDRTGKMSTSIPIDSWEITKTKLNEGVGITSQTYFRRSRRGCSGSMSQTETASQTLSE